MILRCLCCVVKWRGDLLFLLERLMFVLLVISFFRIFMWFFFVVWNNVDLDLIVGVLIDEL